MYSDIEKLQKSIETVKAGLAKTEKAIPEDKAFFKDVRFLAGQATNPEGRSAKNIPCTNRLLNKSVSIIISGITEGNRAAKYAELEKALSEERTRVIPADNTPSLPLLNINIKDNSLEKINKALRAAAFTLDVPLKSTKGEAFTFKAQEDLTDKWAAFYAETMRRLYDFVIEALSLPKITVMSKSDVMTWKGRVLYAPESGEPISKKEWESFVKNLEKFLNRNITDSNKKIVLSAHNLAKILDRMLENNTLEAVRKQRLENLKYKGKTFDWVSDSVKNMRDVYGEGFTRKEQVRIEIAQQSAGERLTHASEKLKSDVKQIVIDGIKNRRSKSQVSQSLFDKMVGHNRDFQRIADMEIQNTFNNAFLKEEVYNTEDGEKAYFKRVEVIDGNTCPYCKKVNGKIAVWSDIPLPSGKIKDPYADFAIWEGKEWDGKKLQSIEDCPTGCCHCWCRGVWLRYYPEFDAKK